jgi:hypothetical protein
MRGAANTPCTQSAGIFFGACLFVKPERQVQNLHVTFATSRPNRTGVLPPLAFRNLRFSREHRRGIIA